MRPPDDPEVREWLTKAAEDRRVVDVLSAAAGPLDDPICFHCQQSAEKLCKALLVAAEIAPPRTHDLEELVALLAPTPAPPLDVQRALVSLSAMAILPRYPVRADQRSPDRAMRAVEHLDRVVAWIPATYGWKVPRDPAEVER
jgi:HEPN domain-containing protein